MKIFYKRILSKKGLTLVEILVVLIVASVLLLCATGMLAPVNNLLNSVKSNAHMDTACDTITEFLRGSISKAEKVCVLPFPHATEEGYNLPSGTLRPEHEALNQKYNEYRNNLKFGEEIRALVFVNNYKEDFRLYDFGTICKINEDGTLTNIKDLNWGLNSGLLDTFSQLISQRDGGGGTENGPGAKPWNEFHKFDAFKEEFYSIIPTDQGNGHSYQVAFEWNGGDYFKISIQVFKRNGDWVFSNWNGKRPVFKVLPSFEPTNQINTLSFKILKNGSVDSETAEQINSISADETTIELITDADGKTTQDGVVFLYVVNTTF